MVVTAPLAESTANGADVAGKMMYEMMPFDPMSTDVARTAPIFEFSEVDSKMVKVYEA